MSQRTSSAKQSSKEIVQPRDAFDPEVFNARRCVPLDCRIDGSVTAISLATAITGRLPATADPTRTPGGAVSPTVPLMTGEL